MKIVLCNKYYFLNGGTERYFSDLVPQLTHMGHECVPFSVRYAGSWDSPFSGYFLPPPGSADQARFQTIRLTPTNWIRHLDRSVYSFEARRYLSRLLDETGGADVAYLLNIYNYMSPSIIHTFRKRGIPVAVQLGDYHLLCPSYLFLRDGRPCTLCLTGNYFHGLRHRCVKKSLGASALRVFSMYVQKWLGLYHRADAFIVPCRFMESKLVEGGFPADRIHLLHYPVSAVPGEPAIRRGNYILYFGRISYEKGLDTLIRAYQQISPDVDLVLVGRDYDGETARLRHLILPEYTDRIRFMGFREGAELSRWIGEALFTVVPSRWYDNAPISIYESFIRETPVVAANLGGIPEQVEECVTGRLFAPESEDDLKDALHWMLSDRGRLREMGRAGKDFVVQRCGIEEHAAGLTEIFKRLRNGSYGSRGKKFAE